MHRKVRSFARSRSGSTAIEYGLIAALVFLAMVTSVELFASKTVSMWTYVASKLK